MTSPTPLPQAPESARELARRIRQRELSPLELVQAALERIDQHRALNAFITVIADEALQAAREAEQAVMDGRPLGPLHGLPYSVKDLTPTAGVRTTMGSFIYEHHVPDQDALAVARAKAAGAILIGKTTTPEFGARQSASAPIFGRTLNPYSAEHTPGASSCGAAVAVACDMGSLALGSDGGGSIRIPASCCGVVGLKATLGVIANLQPGDLFSANSYVGPMARDVGDCALLFDAIRGAHPRDPYGQGPQQFRPRPQSLRGVRIAWLASAGNPVDAAVLRAGERAMHMAQAEGAIVEPIELDFVSLERHFLVILESLTALRLKPHLTTFQDRIDPAIVKVALRGFEHGALDLHEANQAKTRCFQQLQAVFERFDVLASPTVSAPPLPISVEPEGSMIIAGQPAGRIRAAWYPYTYPMNLTGHPALSMPCGLSPEGLPIGLQLAGAWYSDDYLLGIAALLEPLL
jgi:aspartyl-tRNA(Asn)/glutamyl-tRNA(Gln) amidotransferase subunit A